MMLVTGATGTIGSEVARLLAARGEAVRTMSRRPGQDVQADSTDQESLRLAFAGVTAVLLVTAYGSHIAEHDRAMIEAAQAAGVSRAVKISAIGTGETDDPLDPRFKHLAGERALRESGLAWTVLRPAGFASNALRWAAQVRAGEPVPNMTGDGVEPWVDPRDVAAMAVEALAGGGHERQVYTPTGPEALSVPDRVAVVGKVIGRALEVVDVAPEVAAEQLRASGAEPGLVEGALRGMRLIRDGYSSQPTDDVELVLGRPAGTFERWVEDHRAAFSA